MAPAYRATELWKQDAEKNYRKLTVKRGPDFVQVVDGCSNGKGGTYTLDGVAGEAYLACERGATPHRVWSTLSPEYQSGGTEADVKDFLDQMVSMRLVFEENGHYLSLALPKGEGLEATDHPMPGVQEQAPAKLFPAAVV